jgi:hypothetical protein
MYPPLMPGSWTGGWNFSPGRSTRFTRIGEPCVDSATRVPSNRHHSSTLIFPRSVPILSPGAIAQLRSSGL